MTVQSKSKFPIFTESSATSYFHRPGISVCCASTVKLCDVQVTVTRCIMSQQLQGLSGTAAFNKKPVKSFLCCFSFMEQRNNCTHRLHKQTLYLCKCNFLNPCIYSSWWYYCGSLGCHGALPHSQRRNSSFGTSLFLKHIYLTHIQTSFSA